MTRQHLQSYSGQEGYAALFAILLITAIFAISLVNANLSSWQSQSNLLGRNATNNKNQTAEFCQQVKTDNSLGEIAFCRGGDN